MPALFDFEHFYVHWYSRSVAFAMEFLGNRADAENVVQDVFVGIYEKREFLNDGLNMTAYLLTAIKNRCLNHLTNRLRKKTVHADVSSSEFHDRICLESLESFDTGFPDEASIEQRLEKAMQALPERCKQIFVMNKIEGKKQSEVAAELGISVNTVESQMAIAYKKLREELKDCSLLLLFLSFFFN